MDRLRMAPAAMLAALLLSPVAAAPVATQFHGGPDHAGVFTGPSPGNLLRTLWTFDAGNGVISSPVVAGGLVFVGTRGGQMIALDKKTGAVAWRFTADAPITATPAIAEGAVFFQTEANTVYAVDAASGQERWHRGTGATAKFFSMLEGLPEGVNWDYWTSSPLYESGAIFIGSGDSNVYAFAAKDGRTLWSFKTGGRVRATPASDGKRIYIGGFDGIMYALDPGTGARIWSFKTKGNAYFKIGSIQSAAAISGGLVLFGSRDYNLYALDAATGKEVWENLHNESWVPATPAVSNGRVYTPSSDAHFIRCNDLKTGMEIWTVATDSNVFSAPAIVGGELYAGTFGGHLLRLRLSDGHTGGMIYQERIYTSPWADDGVLYFATADGIVYAATDGSLPKPAG